MEYPGVRFYSDYSGGGGVGGQGGGVGGGGGEGGLGQAADLNSDVHRESVDLLQMVPDAVRPRPIGTGGTTTSLQAAMHDASGATLRSKGPPETPPRRMRVLLVQDDVVEDTDDGGGGGGGGGCPDADLHICQGCRENSIYYSKQNAMAQPSCHYDNHQNQAAPDGSVYFNYLQFANRSRSGTTTPGSVATTCAYEPVDRTHLSTSSRQLESNTYSPATSSKFGLNCCKNANLTSSLSSSFSSSNNQKKRKKGKGTFGACSKTQEEDHVTYSSHSNTSSPGLLLNNNRLRKRREWSRLRRLLFLAGILLGILIALGGVIVGFVVLAPHKGKGIQCGPSSMHCGSVGCVSLHELCRGLVDCPGTFINDICFYNGTDARRTQPERTGAGADGHDVLDFVTVASSLERPVKDSNGWVWFTGGGGGRAPADAQSRYTLINRALTFGSAQEVCRKEGGHLVHVDSIREQVFLEDYLHQELQNSDVRRDAIGFWLGARRARGSHSGNCMYHQWKWVDVHGREHGSITGFTAFALNKPDNYFSPEECLFISFSSGDDADNYLKWDDAPCDIHSIGGIKVLCEVDDAS